MRKSCLVVFVACVASLGAIHSGGHVDYCIEQQIADEEAFNLIQTNILNLRNANIVRDSAEELIFLLKEGYRIDPYNMTLLIETLDHANALPSAAQVINVSIEEGDMITESHLMTLIDMLKHANPASRVEEILTKCIAHGVPFRVEHRLALIYSLAHAGAIGHATKVLLIAVNNRIPFGPRELAALAEVSNVANAKSSVQKIRKALHER